jgi:hypothetical protein
MPFGVPSYLKLVEEDILNNTANGGTAGSLRQEGLANATDVMAEDQTNLMDRSLRTSEPPRAREIDLGAAATKPGRTGTYTAGAGPRDAGSNPAAAGGSLQTQSPDELAKAQERFRTAYEQSESKLQNAGMMQGFTQMGRAIAGIPLEKQVERSYVENAMKQYGTPDSVKSKEDAVIRDIMARKQQQGQFDASQGLSREQFGMGQELSREQLAQAKAIADSQLQVQMANAKTQQDQLAAQINHQKAMEKLGWFGANTARINATESKDYAIQAKQNERLERDVQALTKEIPAEAASLKTNLDILSKYENEDDVPGMGPIEGLVPDVMATQAGTEARQAAKGVVSIMMFLTSGKAASDKEVANKLKELGLGERANIDAFKNGVKNIKQQLGQTLQQKMAGFRPEVVDVYKARGGVSPETFASRPKPETQQTSPQASLPTAQAPLSQEPMPPSVNKSPDVKYLPDGRKIYFNQITGKYQTVDPLKQQQDMFK